MNPSTEKRRLAWISGNLSWPLSAPAQRILEKDIADVVLFDVVDGMPQGKALDLMEAAPLEGHSRRVVGTNDYKEIQGAEIVVVTAGLPRKPGMSREDLLSLNAKIIEDVCTNIRTH